MDCRGIRFATRIELASASASSGLTTWPPKRHGQPYAGPAHSTGATHSGEAAPAPAPAPATAAAPSNSGRNSAASVALTEVDAQEERLVKMDAIPQVILHRFLSLLESFENPSASSGILCSGVDRSIPNLYPSIHPLGVVGSSGILH